MHEGKKPNRLIHEKSPYLLQHAYNPVDWFPWGDEAFGKARREDKPIFLSVGYSTCYWCHVMEREVFENDSIAKLMNEKLVCIKVDREERPDIDRVYMTAVQAMTGSGGWPMSVFLTPDLKPFFGATYIPPKAQYGRPGFPDIVSRISELWKTNRDTLLESSNQITDYIKSAAGSAQGIAVNESVLENAFQQFAQSYDSVHGGFGGAPKFPRPVAFNFLLRRYARTKNENALQMTLATLREMSKGGVYDHVGGGFHRYSVDAEWRVPHFEKMLYDQAQLVVSYLEAYQITHDTIYSSVARNILDYIIRNLTDKQGGFYSAEDAESAPDRSKPNEKEEGAFYLWTKAEVAHLLGKEDAAIFSYNYGVEDSGNAPHDPMNVFVGKNILYIAHGLEETAKHFDKTREEAHTIVERARLKLFRQREKRPKPHLDDKIITAWNGLTISAFAKAYQILGEESFLKTGESAAHFAMTKLYNPDTRTLYRRYRDGESRFDGSLQDYAFLVQGLLDLYEASFNIVWLEHAIALTKKQNELFRDASGGGFFDGTGKDSTVLIRTKEEYDSAEPTGNSIAALNLLRLSQITDKKEWRSMAEKTVTAFGVRLQRTPEALPQMLVAFDWLLSTPKEVIIAGQPNSEATRALLEEVHSHFIPNKILLLADGADGQKKLQSYLPFVEGMRMKNGKATAYICENYACQLPTSDRAVVARLLTQETKKSSK
ncbi:MAG: thioredoxin domain-containing protein [Ignavibacteriae bacterium]|nr:thioredoxin domain-containing protein [Ignavibacteria bacterium]MBI3363511.1 thioredoxin domain-containing protein [Ignavibacteriota bacterium]